MLFDDHPSVKRMEKNAKACDQHPDSCPSPPPSFCFPLPTSVLLSQLTFHIKFVVLPKATTPYPHRLKFGSLGRGQTLMMLPSPNRDSFTVAFLPHRVGGSTVPTRLLLHNWSTLILGFGAVNSRFTSKQSFKEFTSCHMSPRHNFAATQPQPTRYNTYPPTLRRVWHEEVQPDHTSGRLQRSSSYSA
jgi:hypothetical protein